MTKFGKFNDKVFILPSVIKLNYELQVTNYEYIHVMSSLLATYENIQEFYLNTFFIFCSPLGVRGVYEDSRRPISIF